MQNEFEKQVHQKMEELTIIPSDPVWKKVEQQLRKKKDRRRLLLWLPPVVLFLGAGFWFFMNDDLQQNTFNHSSEKNYRQKKKLAKPQQTIHNKTIVETTTKKQADKTKTHSEALHKNVSGTATISTFNEPSIRKKTLAKTKQNNQPQFVLNKNAAEQKMESVVKGERMDFASSINNRKKINEVDNASSILQQNTNSSLSNRSKIKALTTELKVVFIGADTALQTQAALKKSAASKWNYALLLNGGASGLSSLFNRQQFFGAAPNFSSGPPNGGSGAFYYGTSAVKNDWSLAVGIAATKQLSKRTSFSTGVHYQYYSNSILVGNKITQDTILANFAVSQYYSGSGATLQPYRNQYHFFSIPVGVNLQLLKKIPLHLYAGLSLQYLIQTNALRFDYNSQSYFHNKKAFNSTQLFSGLGLHYSLFLKQQVLLFGPQLQYSFTRIEKGSRSSPHLFSYGVSAQWQWRKK